MNGIRSITHNSEDVSDKTLAKQWRKFPWKKARAFVKRLQTRIAKAVKNGNYRLAKRLQSCSRILIMLKYEQFTG